MKKLIAKSLIILIPVCLYSCANIVTPQGGKKDVTPPQILGIYPENGTVQFSENSIQILFDEYIQITDWFNQLIISPPMSTVPAYKIKGKRLIINFLEPLKDSTTYTINFGSSIKDITESNTLENLIYVFSTGNNLDSMVIGGNITSIYSGKAEKNAIAVLYPEGLDSTIRFSKPWYFAKADQNGNFLIQNIKSGNYYLYGLLDQNFNYYYDLPNEMIAFPDSLIHADSSNQNIKLLLFSEDKVSQQLLEAKSINVGSSRLVFSKDVDSTIIIPEQDLLEMHNKSNDTIYYWSADTAIKEHKFRIQFDSTDTVVAISIKPFINQTGNFITTNFISVSKSPNSSETPYLVDPNTLLRIISNYPIKQFDTQLIHIYEDTLTTSIPATFILDSTSIETLICNLNFTADKNYHLVIEPDAIQHIYGDNNDSLSMYFKIRKTEDFGNLKISIISEITHPMFLELVNSDLVVLRDVYLVPGGQKEIQMKFLKPGTYNLRARIDLNQNKKWDTGDLQLLVQPEPIIFYENQIPIRSNWDQSIDWNIIY